MIVRHWRSQVSRAHSCERLKLRVRVMYARVYDLMFRSSPFRHRHRRARSTARFVPSPSPRDARTEQNGLES